MIIRDNFLLILHSNIPVCCGPSSELSHQDDLDEGSQHMFFIRNKKIIPRALICYTPGIYAEGYIVFAFPFVHLYVCSLLSVTISFWLKFLLLSKSL